MSKKVKVQTKKADYPNDQAATANSAHDVDQASLIAVEQRFSGPLPHPTILREYEKVLPGASERILKMAETQISHRQEIELKVISSNTFTEKLGLVLGFILLMSLIVIGALLLFLDKNITGYALIFVGAGTPLGSYIYSIRRGVDKNQKDEPEVGS